MKRLVTESFKSADGRWSHWRRCPPAAFVAVAFVAAAFAGCSDGGAPVKATVGRQAPLAAGAAWQQVGVTPSLESTAITYDSARKKVWHFEVDPRVQPNVSRMWGWDGSAWTLGAETTGAAGAPTGPGASSFFPVMTYDSLRERVVLFGHTSVSETWSWDGASWTLATNLPLSPPARDYEAIAYDSARAEVLLFGGVAIQAPGNNLNDTWAWNGATWTQRTVTGPVPPGGRDVRMAYDVARAKTVLLTGGSTWEWDGMAWQQRLPAASPMLSGTLAYDTTVNAVVLLGGYGGQPQLWQWNGDGWTARTGSTTTLSVGDIAYDSARNAVVLLKRDLGGLATWEWDGAGWQARFWAPPAQAGPLMAYDLARQEVVLFGDGAMWTWNGSLWRPKRVAGPAASSTALMAYDVRREKVVLFDGETWEWDGTTWEQRVSAGAAPVAGKAMTYDGGRGNVLLVGGASAAGAETWTWDGNSWTQLSPGNAPPNANDVLAYDSARDRVVLFSSPGRRLPFSSQTWEWDGADWTLRYTGDPLDQDHPGMAFDVDRGKVVLVGAGTWEWNGQSWSQLPGGAGPAARDRTALVFDSVRHALVLFGGANRVLSLPSYGDTWELRAGPIACTSDAQCATGSCVDGVCCNTTEASCGVCRACNVPGSEGTCSPRAGACDDGNACTRVDSCQAGQCVGTDPVSCAPQGECRLAGACDPATGLCSNPAAGDGTPCSGGICPTPPPDGGLCLGNMCVGGECRTNLCAGVSCAATDACHQPGTCDPATGACSSPAMPDGTACDDGDPRTRVDRCRAGTCVGSDQPPPPRRFWRWWYRIFHWHHR